MISAFTFYANYHFIINNKEGVSKSLNIFQKFGMKCLKIIFFLSEITFNFLIEDINPFYKNTEVVSI